MSKLKTDSKSSSAPDSGPKLRASKNMGTQPALAGEMVCQQPRGKPQQVPQRTQDQSGATASKRSVDTLVVTPTDQEWLDQMIQFGVAPMIAKAHVKHRHDLPALMRQHAYEWVAYHGERPLEIGPSQAALYHKYLDQGMDLNELVVLGIGPEPPTKLQVDELLDS